MKTENAKMDEIVLDVDSYDTNTLIAVASDIVIELRARGLSDELIAEEIEL